MSLPAKLFFPFTAACALFLGCFPSETTDVSTPDGIRNALKKNPEDTAALYARVKYFINEKKYDSALVDMKTLIGKDSERSDYYVTIGDIYLYTNQTRFTRDAFEKAIKIKPSNQEAQMKLAELFLYVKMYKESIDHLDEVLKVNKRNPKAYYMKGIAFKEAGDTAMAMSSFLTATEQDAEYALAYEQLGLIYAANHDPRALDFYKNALRINPKNALVFYNIGLFYQENGEQEKAAETYRELLELQPDYYYAAYNLGYMAFLKKNDMKNALSWFEKAVSINPEYFEGIYMIGLCQENLGNIQIAISAYKKCLAIQPKYTLAMKALERLGVKEKL